MSIRQRSYSCVRSLTVSYLKRILVSINNNLIEIHIEHVQSLRHHRTAFDVEGIAVSGTPGATDIGLRRGEGA